MNVECSSYGRTHTSAAIRRAGRLASAAQREARNGNAQRAASMLREASQLQRAAAFKKLVDTYA